MSVLEHLEPKSVFRFFEELCAIPHGSGNTKAVSDWLMEFARSRNLEAYQDAMNNVVIIKEATPGYESAEPVILQGHMDMVCDKLVDVDIDFTKDAIQTYIDGEWLKAKGTTLGADDGIGCAIELAILDSNEIEHGPIECVFTRDEETGLTGAHGMEAGFMTGKMLINMDSEDEGQIFVSCAGGQTIHATFDFEREQAPAGYFFIKLSLKGLNGGHSGDDINKKRANAIKLLARFLYLEMEKFNGDIRLVNFNSGKMHNAIPRDGQVVLAIKNEVKEQVRIDWNIFASEVEEEFHVTEKDMVFNMESAESSPVIEKTIAEKFIMALQAVDNGPLTTCQDEAIAWMVETSSNVASVITTDNSIDIVASQRSNVMSNLENMTNTVKAAFQLAGAKITVGDKYPAWKMRSDSKLTEITVKSYEKLFGKKPLVKGIHAGLECGLFSEKYPDLDMVSFGPTLREVHTPQEALYIPTVQMVWDHLLEILRNAPRKG